MKFRLSAGLWCLGNFAERYVPGGYHDDFEFEEQLEILSKVKGLDGIGIVYPTEPLPSDPDKIVKKFADFGLQVADVTVDNFSDKKWKFGAMTTNEKNIQKENIAICKEAIDFTFQLKNSSLLIWPAHDGFDYPFQVDYEEGWKNMVASFKEICAYNPKVKISVEYKSKDPRQKEYISNFAKMMILFNDVGMNNLTGALDTGHALLSQESLAESAMLLKMHGKLNTIHLNDNYRDADSDLIFGTTAFWDNLELYYYLKKISFQGWHEIDIVVPRDDRIKSLNLVVNMARKYEYLAGELLKYSKVIDENLRSYNFADNMELIKDAIFIK
jgi:xylose isomerase